MVSGEKPGEIGDLRLACLTGVLRQADRNRMAILMGCRDNPGYDVMRVPA